MNKEIDAWNECVSYLKVNNYEVWELVTKIMEDIKAAKVMNDYIHLEYITLITMNKLSNLMNDSNQYIIGAIVCLIEELPKGDFIAVFIHAYKLYTKEPRWIMERLQSEYRGIREGAFNIIKDILGNKRILEQIKFSYIDDLEKILEIKSNDQWCYAYIAARSLLEEFKMEKHNNE